MNAKQLRRMAKYAETSRANGYSAAERSAIRETLKSSVIKGHAVHVPTVAYRNLMPKSGFNAHRCA
jgi:hypothetical protein